MACKYCFHFVKSEKRINDVREDGSQNREKPQRRLCKPTTSWQTVNADPDCEHFTPNDYFWCDRHMQEVSIDACRNRRLKKLSKHCKTCKQYSDVLDCIRFRTIVAARVAADSANA